MEDTNSMYRGKEHVVLTQKNILMFSKPKQKSNKNLSSYLRQPQSHDIFLTILAKITGFSSKLCRIWEVLCACKVWFSLQQNTGWKRIALPWIQPQLPRLHGTEAAELEYNYELRKTQLEMDLSINPTVAVIRLEGRACSRVQAAFNPPVLFQTESAQDCAHPLPWAQHCSELHHGTSLERRTQFLI